MSYNRSGGFALVEVIVAMIIIAIIAVVTLEFYRVCIGRFVGNSRLSIEAVDFGREKMEELYFLSPSDLIDCTDIGAPLPDSIPGVFPNELKDKHAGTRKYTITTKPEGYKVIETRVEWTL